MVLQKRRIQTTATRNKKMRRRGLLSNSQVAVRQIETLLRFVNTDKESMQHERLLMDFELMKRTMMIYTAYKQGLIQYDKIREAPEDLRNNLLDIIEDPEEYMMRMRELEDDLDSMQELPTLTHAVASILIRNTLPRYVFKIMLGLNKMITPVEQLYREPNTILDRLLKYHGTFTDCYNVCKGCAWAIRMDHCRYCLKKPTKPEKVKTCPACQVIVYCNGYCKAEDMKNTGVGHKYVECDLLIVSKKLQKREKPEFLCI